MNAVPTVASAVRIAARTFTPSPHRRVSGVARRRLWVFPELAVSGIERNQEVKKRESTHRERFCEDSAPSFEVWEDFRRGQVYGGNRLLTLCAPLGRSSVLSASFLPLLVFNEMAMEVTAVESFFTWEFS